MLFACWAVKGGAGTTVLASSLALTLSRSNPLGGLLVDLSGEAPAVLGLAGNPASGVASWLARSGAPASELAALEVGVGHGLSLLPRGEGPLSPAWRHAELLDALAADARPVVVDCGLLSAAVAGSGLGAVVAGASTHSLLVTRRCFLSLRRAVDCGIRPTAVVLVSEPGRSLSAPDVEGVLGAPVVVDVPYDPAVARAVDAGLLARRLPASLARAARALVA